MVQAALFGNNPKDVERVYGLGRRERISSLYDLYDTVITENNIGDHIGNLKDVEFIFSTWGMFVPKEEYMNAMPRLKAVCYAASSVKAFAEPFLRRGVQVISAACANAEFVADFAASQIQLAAKGFFRTVRSDVMNNKEFYQGTPAQGFFEINVGLIGMGFVGRLTMERLRKPGIHVYVYDPYLGEEQAEKLHVTKTSLDELFNTCYVISNHAPDTEETRGMLQYRHFASMRKGATFINTGRGISVVESDMIRALQERHDLVAVLDVTWPEPPMPDSPLLKMPNVFYTPHIAGAHGNEVRYMADLCIQEAEMIRSGQAAPHSVTLERLRIMA